MNGLAGISIIKQDFPHAVSLYKEAMDLVERHSGDFRLDPLLNIHIHHNLAEALLLTENSSQKKSISDDSLSIPSILLREDETSSDFQPCISLYVQRLNIACEDHKQKFLSIFTSKLSLAQQEFRRSHEQVC